MPSIDREVLLGHRGNDTRYWGYCLPSPGNPPQSEGLPGKIFLSEAERAWRSAHAPLQSFSILHPPTSRALQSAATGSLIRHQIEVFRGGMSCYLMTEKPLPIGTDRDGDGLNSALERQYGTDPNNPDTDGDGVSDGDEVFKYHTDPLRRDTDGDGLIDGIEVLYLHTDPLRKDTDRDGLCDGLCRVTMRQAAQYCPTQNGDQGILFNDCISFLSTLWVGENRALDGIIHPGETNPLKADSKGDGVLDGQRVFTCIIAKWRQNQAVRYDSTSFDKCYR